MYLGTKPSENPVVLKNVSNKHLTETGKQNWLSYWKYFSRTDNNQCAEEGCTEHHHHGVLVKEENCVAEKLFVVPVCQNHSQSDKFTLIPDNSLDIVSAELSL